MLKPKIFINLLQLLCIVVSVAQTDEFDRFQWWVLRWRWLVLHVCAFSGLQNTLETQINLCVWFDPCEDRRLNQNRSTAPALSNWFRHRISHELNSLNLIRLIWSMASEPGLGYARAYRVFKELSPRYRRFLLKLVYILKYGINSIAFQSWALFTHVSEWYN